jgi:hypothetical protein
MDGETLRGGRYVVTKILGEGAQGSTFEAVDKVEGRLVAIKRFDVRGARAWKDVELAEREARVLASLAHPRLPAYIEHFEEGGRLYLVMQKIEGKSLGQRLKAGERLEEREVARLLHDAADALEYLHGRGVVHRDLKPGNVIQRDDGSFAFVDFGAVRDRIRVEGGSTVVGTFGYMAPEQFQGRALPASDVYAIGATSIALLTGRQPEELPHRGLAIDVSAALRGVASDALVRTLARMLEPDPEKRAARIELPGGAARPSWNAPPRSRGSEGWRASEGRREARRAEREVRRARRRAARVARRAGAGRRLPFFPLIFVLLALAVARVAISLALFVVVPAFLTMLSVLFGSALRDAARAVTQGGRRAYEAIEDQARDFSGGGSEGRNEEEEARVRVEGNRTRVGAQESEDGEDEEDEGDEGDEGEGRRQRRL